MDYYLGLNLRSHDVAYYLLNADRDLIFGIEEERLAYTRYMLPATRMALDYMLDREGIDRERVRAIGLAGCSAGYEAVLKRHESVFDPAEIAGQRRFVQESFELQHSMINSMGFKQAEVFEVPHHLCHAISGFAQSGFPSAVVLAIDGSGDESTTALFHCQDDHQQTLLTIDRPHSLGWIWEAITQWSRLGKLGNEGKLMGLASYGTPRYVKHFYEGFKARDGKPVVFFDVDWRTGAFTSPVGEALSRGRFVLQDLFGEAESDQRMPGEFARDIAASLQVVTNQIMLALCRWARLKTGESHLVLTGGVAMNSVANGEIIRRAGYGDVFVPPNASDNGLGVGSALVALNRHRRNDRAHYCLGRHQLPYVGPRYGRQEISRALESADLPVSMAPSRQQLLMRVAELLRQGKVVGWFQDRMEIGARALGNRSILASPCIPDMKDIVNERVKFREHWRPFAPLIKQEAYTQWFEDDHADVPYMTSTHMVKADRRGEIPAVVHVDGSARVQTCAATFNPLLHGLLTAFEALTGVPILLNTSFNVQGMPIVCKPADAISCYLATGLDVLVMDHFVVCKDQHEPRVVDRNQLTHLVRFFDDQVEDGDVVYLLQERADEQPLTELNPTIEAKRLEVHRILLDRADRELSMSLAPGAKFFVLIDYADNFPNGYALIKKPLQTLKKLRLHSRIADERLFLLNRSGASWKLSHMFDDRQWAKVMMDQGDSLRGV